MKLFVVVALSIAGSNAAEPSAVGLLASAHGLWYSHSPKVLQAQAVQQAGRVQQPGGKGIQPVLLVAGLAPVPVIAALGTIGAGMCCRYCLECEGLDHSVCPVRRE